MKIKDLMVTDVTSIESNESIAEVAELIFSKRFHGLPVVHEGKVVGIVTEDDFFLKNYGDVFLPAYIKFIDAKKIIANLPEEIQDKIASIISAKVSTIMTREVITVSPEMNANELMKLIKQTKFTTFPVTDKERNILGIITLSDILGTVKRGSGEMKKSLLKKSKKSKIGNLVVDLNYFWNDQLLVTSRKNVRTLRGILFIVTIEALIILILAKFLI